LFGEVRKSEVELIQKFGVTKFPTLLVITDPNEFTSDMYEEDLRIDRMTKFLNKYSYQTVKYEKKVEF
jgi:hypothetical protein